jgi:hypothetical protein
LTIYEICRVYLNTQASTGKLDPYTSKLLICCYFFLRLLIKEVLLKVETVLGNSTTEKSKKFARSDQQLQVPGMLRLPRADQRGRR